MWILFSLFQKDFLIAVTTQTWIGKEVSNLQPTASEAVALPIELFPNILYFSYTSIGHGLLSHPSSKAVMSVIPQRVHLHTYFLTKKDFT